MNNGEQLLEEFSAVVKNVTSYTVKIQKNGAVIVLEKGNILDPDTRSKNKVFIMIATAALTALLTLMALVNELLKYDENATFFFVVSAVACFYYGLIKPNVFGGGVFGQNRRVTVDIAQQKFYIEEPPNAYTIKFRDITKIQAKNLVNWWWGNMWSYGAVKVWSVTGKNVLIESKEYARGPGPHYFTYPNSRSGIGAEDFVRESMKPLCDMLEILIRSNGGK